MTMLTTLAVDIAAMKTISLVVFIGFWIAVVARLLATRSDRFRHAARIPLDD